MSNWPIAIDPVFGCWTWTSKLDRDGYGIAYAGGRRRAHIAVYEAEVGPVPDGLELDHECRMRACVNPKHLLPVTKSVNGLRKSWRFRVQQKTCRHCGADMKLTAMITTGGGRVCRCTRGART